MFIVTDLVSLTKHVKIKTPTVRDISTTFMKKVTEYDQEIPQSETADKPMTPRRRAKSEQQHTKGVIIKWDGCI